MSAPTVVRAFAEQVALAPDRVALSLLRAGGAPVDETLTWREWDEHALAFAAALLIRGVRSGDVIAILANNDFVWPIADIGSLRAGCVSVGIFPSSPAAQIAAVLASCNAGLIVAGGAEQAAQAAAALALLGRTALIVSPAFEDAEGGNPERCSWAAWLEQGRAALTRDAVRLELSRRERAVTPADLAALMYTSGSTGEPKGVRLSHRYLAASARSIGAVLELGARDRSLSFLPYSHAAERIFGHYTRICFGMAAGLVPDHTRVWDAARAFRPTIFGGLPRFYEKVVEQLHAEIAAADGERNAIERALAAGAARSRLRRAGAPIPPELETQWREYGAPLHARVRASFGGDVRLATSGGAMLLPSVAEMLDAAGITVLGAYGMTEHLCVTFNRPDCYAFDTAGPAMPGTDLRIADNGEILVRRCELTFDGYHDDDAATVHAFTADGVWLRTGDLGTLDARGMLRVTGRLKELIALSTGKKVAPLPIEARLAQTPLIGQAVLYGEGRKFITALLTLRRAQVEAWAAAQGLTADWPALLEDAVLLRELQGAVDSVNVDLSAPERVRRFLVLERELSAEQDELTATHKIRRDAVAQRFGEQLDALYREPR